MLDGFLASWISPMFRCPRNRVNSTAFLTALLQELQLTTPANPEMTDIAHQRALVTQRTAALHQFFDQYASRTFADPINARLVIARIARHHRIASTTALDALIGNQSPAGNPYVQGMYYALRAEAAKDHSAHCQAAKWRTRAIAAFQNNQFRSAQIEQEIRRVSDELKCRGRTPFLLWKRRHCLRNLARAVKQLSDDPDRGTLESLLTYRHAELTYAFMHRALAITARLGYVTSSFPFSVFIRGFANRAMRVYRTANRITGQDADWHGFIKQRLVETILLARGPAAIKRSAALLIQAQALFNRGKKNIESALPYGFHEGLLDYMCATTQQDDKRRETLQNAIAGLSHVLRS